MDQSPEHVQALLASYELNDDIPRPISRIAEAWNRLFSGRRGRVDQLVGFDEHNQPAALSAMVDTIPVAQRAARLRELATTSLKRSGDVQILDPGLSATLREAIGWDASKDGDFMAVRAHLVGNSNGGGQLDVAASFDGGDYTSNKVKMLAVVTKDLDDAERRGATVTQALMSIKNSLSNLPDRKLRRLNFAIREGGVDMQFTEIVRCQSGKYFG